MRLINPNSMVRALRNDAVRHWEYILYAVLWVSGWVIGVWVWYVTDYNTMLLRYIDLFITASVLVGGTSLAWYINRRGDGKHFWQRYVSIDMSLLIPTIVIVIITQFIYSLVRAFQTDGAFFTKNLTDAADVIYATIIALLILVWSLLLMCRVSKQDLEVKAK